MMLWRALAAALKVLPLSDDIRLGEPLQEAKHFKISEKRCSCPGAGAPLSQKGTSTDITSYLNLLYLNIESTRKP